MTEVDVGLLSEPTAEERLQATPWFVVSPVSVALTLNCWPWLIVCGPTVDRAMTREFRTSISIGATTLVCTVEVAVMVTAVASATGVGAVYVTEVEVWLLRVPKLAGERLHVTPPRDAAAVTVTVRPGSTNVAVRANPIVTPPPPVIGFGKLLPPPHPAKRPTAVTRLTAEIPRTSILLSDRIAANSFRQHVGNIGTAKVAQHASAALHNQARLLNIYRPVSHVGSLFGSDGVGILPKERAE